MMHYTYQQGGVNLASPSALERFRRTRRFIRAWFACRCGTATFALRGKKLRYYLHSYNQTWTNERCVEVAIAVDWVRGRSTSLLEVGNVMTHYGVSGHDVLDKYEVAGFGAPLIKEDILKFAFLDRYNNLLSVSTIEHVGHDEEVGDSTLAVDALKRIENSLPFDGEALVTFASGYNEELDEYVRGIAASESGKWQISYLLRRGPIFWQEADPSESARSTYGIPFTCGNGCFVLTIGK